MWENKILIMHVKKLEQEHPHIKTEAQIAFLLEEMMNEVTHDGWEPYHISDDDTNDMVLVWCKRYNPDL